MLISVVGFAYHAWGDVGLSSWYTERSGRYARLYQSTADEANGESVTIWSRNQGTQALPVYAGIQEVSHSEDWIYIKASGLGTHVMGPWYLNEAKTQDFPNFPANRNVIYRIPITPTIPVNKTGTSPGAIGYFVDGVAMFDSTDTFSYSNSNNRDGSPVGNIGRGDGIWNRDAYVNEGVTFDAAFAHQAGSQYHYHANPPGLRHALGDNVDYDEATNVYTENFIGSHSPIIGWVADGLPIYGPYGYSDPLDNESSVRRMISGYQKRDGTNGSVNVNTAGRQSLPQWVNTLEGRTTALSSSEYGPNVNGTYTLGHYLEDYAYKGDLGLTLGSDFDLNAYNVRYCVTPEFPEGTWAYFTCIEENGIPAFPYNISLAYYGSPVAGTVNSIPESVSVYFEGGPGKKDTATLSDLGAGSDEVVITWDIVEGGNYRIESTHDMTSWNTEESFLASTDTSRTEDVEAFRSGSQKYYRIVRESVENYDD